MYADVFRPPLQRSWYPCSEKSHSTSSSLPFERVLGSVNLSAGWPRRSKRQTLRLPVILPVKCQCGCRAFKFGHTVQRADCSSRVTHIDAESCVNDNTNVH
jgi:hypothetical protein